MLPVWVFGVWVRGGWGVLGPSRCQVELTHCNVYLSSTWVNVGRECSQCPRQLGHRSDPYRGDCARIGDIRCGCAAGRFDFQLAGRCPVRYIVLMPQARSATRLHHH